MRERKRRTRGQKPDQRAGRGAARRDHPGQFAVDAQRQDAGHRGLGEPFLRQRAGAAQLPAVERLEGDPEAGRQRAQIGFLREMARRDEDAVGADADLDRAPFRHIGEAGP